MKCNKCGSYLQDGISFCPFCGNSLNADVNMVRNVVPANNTSVPTGENNNSLAIKILAVIGGIMCIVGIFLPYVKATAFGFAIERSFKELADEDAIIFMVVAGIGLLGSIFGTYIISVLTGVLYGIFFFIDSNSYFSRFADDRELSAIAGKGAGYYCMLAGFVIMVVFGFIGVSIMIRNRIDKRRNERAAYTSTYSNNNSFNSSNPRTDSQFVNHLCPNCGATVSVLAIRSGEIKCPNCETVFQVDK